MLKASRTAHRLSAKPVAISKSSESEAAMPKASREVALRAMFSLSEKLLFEQCSLERAARRLSCRGPLWGMKKCIRCTATVPISKSRQLSNSFTPLPEK